MNPVKITYSVDRHIFDITNEARNKGYLPAQVATRIIKRRYGFSTVEALRLACKHEGRHPENRVQAAILVIREFMA